MSKDNGKQKITLICRFGVEIKSQESKFIEFDIFINITSPQTIKKTVWFVNEFNSLRINAIKATNLLAEYKKCNTDYKTLSMLTADKELNVKIWNEFINELDIGLNDVFGLELIAIKVSNETLKLPSDIIKWDNIINVLCNMYDIYHPEQLSD